GTQRGFPLFRHTFTITPKGGAFATGPTPTLRVVLPNPMSPLVFSVRRHQSTWQVTANERALIDTQDERRLFARAIFQRVQTLYRSSLGSAAPEFSETEGPAGSFRVVWKTTAQPLVGRAVEATPVLDRLKALMYEYDRLGRLQLQFRMAQIMNQNA